MIKYDITGFEFEKRLKEGDIVCNLAQMLAHDSLGKDFNLSTKRPLIIVKFINRAEELIEKLNKYGLEIIKK